MPFWSDCDMCCDISIALTLLAADVIGRHRMPITVPSRSDITGSLSGVPCGLDPKAKSAYDLPSSTLAFHTSPRMGPRREHDLIDGCFLRPS